MYQKGSFYQSIIITIIILIRSKESETLIDRVSDSAPTDESESVGERAFCFIVKKDFLPTIFLCVSGSTLQDYLIFQRHNGPNA